MARRRLSGLRAMPVAAALLAVAGVAHADDAQPSAERIKAAAEEFDQGRRAFLSKDYENAGVHFENAYRDAPRAETLRLAIRARREGKQLARAATLAAIAQETYASDAATAQLAKDTLAEAGPELAELDVTCATDCSVTADGRVVSQADARSLRIFLDPGPHDLGIGFKSGSVAKKVDAKKGSKTTLAFEPPPSPSSAPSTVPSATPPASPPPPVGARRPLAPVVFWIGAGLTVVAAGATVWSGIDTQQNPGTDRVRAECAGKDTSCPAYQEGKDHELRTNVLLATTGVLAVGTAVIGAFFTDWSGPSRTAKSTLPATVGLGPSGAVVSGRF